MTGEVSPDHRPTGVTYVIGTYPSLTTTFIDREIDQLRQHGLRVDVIALRRPGGDLSPDQAARVPDVTYVLPVGVGSLLRSHLWFLLRRPGAFLGTFAFLLTRPHPRLKARLRTILHFGEGVYVSHLVRDRAHGGHLHAHFVDRATVVALVASRLLGLTYSATAHANDIYVDPVLLPEKIAGARFVATCTNQNAATLSVVAGPCSSDRIVRIYHGLDVEGYTPAMRRAPGAPVILSVGQLKEKKGFTHLVEACRILRDRGYDFRCDIVGEGPLRLRLHEQVRRLSLEDTVSLSGALPHGDVIERYRSATIFTLPCVTATDGDRDGIPNVILEAMAMELPVVSSRHSGIPEAVEDGWSGLLVPAGDPGALADALARLLDDPATGELMGRRGRQLVASNFDISVNAKELMARFGEEGA